jgi:hypothetical protein
MSKISKALDKRIRLQAKNRCGYCLTLQELIPVKLEIEHIYPTSRGGADAEENLWLACRECNLHKGSKIFGFDDVLLKRVRLFNPRKQRWSEHFTWNKDKTLIVGKTACGRATVLALNLNNDYVVTTRHFWKDTNIFPPKD